MKRRGYKPQFTTVDIKDIPRSWKQDWTPTQEAIQINQQRIKERT